MDLSFPSGQRSEARTYSNSVPVGTWTGPDGKAHPESEHNLVTDAAWYGRTNTGGSFAADVPRGRYRVALWHPRLRDEETDLARELTVAEGDRAELTLRLSRSLQPAPLADRPHSWDY